MTNLEKPPIIEADYKRFQACLEGALWKAQQDGADDLSIAHALAPVAVEVLLNFHPPEAVKTMFAHQIDVIAAMKEVADEVIN